MKGTGRKMTTNLIISNEKYVEKKDSALENTLVNEISFIKMCIRDRYTIMI